MTLPDPAHHCDRCRNLHFSVTGARSEVYRARRRLRKHGFDELTPRYVAETKAAVVAVTDAETRYLAHHAEAHPVPAVVLPGTDNDRAPSHRKPALPPAAELAARVRAGETLAAIAASYERTAKVLARRLSMAGFVSTTGEPRKQGADGLPTLARPWDTRAWLDEALCAQTDPEAFFPEVGGSGREAKAVCNGDPARGIEPCPVKAACLDDALANDDRYGIRAGLTEKQRRGLKNGRAS